MRYHATNPALDQPHLGALLRALRERAGWSITRLGVEAGIDHTHVWRIEQGRRAASATALRALADALGLDATQATGLLLAGGFLPIPYPLGNLEQIVGLRSTD